MGILAVVFEFIVVIKCKQLLSHAIIHPNPHFNLIILIQNGKQMENIIIQTANKIGNKCRV